VRGFCISAILCFHSALSATLWFQPHAAAPNATLKTNGFFNARGQFMVPEAVKLWVQSHHKDTQGVGYCGRFHGGLLRKYPQLVETPSARPTGYFHFSL